MLPREKSILSTISRFRTAVTLALVSPLLCLLALWLWDRAPLARLPWMRVEAVELHVEWPLTEEKVRGYLPALEGTSLFAVKPSDLLGSLEGKPWVRTVTLKKEFPNRLFLDVTAKRAQAVVTVKGEAYFVDGDGRIVDRASPAILRALDLPVIAPDPRAARGGSSAAGLVGSFGWAWPSAQSWEPAQVMRILERLRRELEPEYRVSEIALSAPPAFRVFLSPIRSEAQFSVETFDAQLPRLRLLLDSPSFPKWQPHRINLVFPKKAIVSAILSK